MRTLHIPHDSISDSSAPSSLPAPHPHCWQILRKGQGRWQVFTQCVARAPPCATCAASISTSGPSNSHYDHVLQCCCDVRLFSTSSTTLVQPYVLSPFLTLNFQPVPPRPRDLFQNFVQSMFQSVVLRIAQLRNSKVQHMAALNKLGLNPAAPGLLCASAHRRTSYHTSAHRRTSYHASAHLVPRWSAHWCTSYRASAHKRTVSNRRCIRSTLYAGSWSNSPPLCLYRVQKAPCSMYCKITKKIAFFVVEPCPNPNRTGPRPVY